MKLLQTYKIKSIDIIRGLILVLLAINHVKNYFGAETIQDSFISYFVVNISFFLTDFCIPAILFLILTSPLLYMVKEIENSIANQVVLRGFVLIFVEIFIYYIFRLFNISHDIINFNSLTVIGFCMIVFGSLIYLSKKAILILGLSLIFGQNFLEILIEKNQNFIYFINNNIFGFENSNIDKSEIFWFSYPIIPWIGVLLLAYYYSVLEKEENNYNIKSKFIYKLGLSSILLFFLIKSADVYVISSTQEGITYSLISFFKIAEYSISVKLLLIILGPILVFLSFIKSKDFNLTEKSFLFGKFPFYIYAAKVFVIHTTAFIGLLIADDNFIFLGNGISLTANYPYSLVMMYVVLISISLLIYPLLLKHENTKIDNENINWLVKNY